MAATRVSILKGTAAECSGFTGLIGELVYDSTAKAVRVHDGTTVGGFALARADGSNWAVPVNLGTGAGVLITSTGPVTAKSLKAGTNVTLTSSPTDITIGVTGGGGGVTDHGALTGLANDDHTQYLIGNVGTSTTRNSITMGVGGRGLNIDAVDSVDTHIRLTLSGVQFATWNNEAGIVIEPGAGGIQADSLQVLASNTGRATVNIPHGTAPTTPVNGDIWTTTSGVFARVNGSTVGPLLGNGNAPGSTGQIIYNGGGGGFTTSSGLTFDVSSNGGLSVPNGHFIFGGNLPNRHTQTAGFKGVWIGGNNTNACLMGETSAGFRGYELQANVVRGTGPNDWYCQDTTQPAWQMFNGYETSSSDTWMLRRAPATADSIGSAWQTIFQVDRNLRAAFAAAVFSSTTGFTAKLAVDNVGGTASDSVLLLRGNASQSGNYLTTQTSGGSALTTIGTNGELTVRQGTSTVRLQTNATGIGFFGVTPVARPAVTGSRGGNAALASLLTQLASLGLITDSTTA